MPKPRTVYRVVVSYRGGSATAADFTTRAKADDAYSKAMLRWKRQGRPGRILNVSRPQTVTLKGY